MENDSGDIHKKAKERRAWSGERYEQVENIVIEKDSLMDMEKLDTL
jgi:hypothetical protein